MFMKVTIYVQASRKLGFSTLLEVIQFINGIVCFVLLSKFVTHNPHQTNFAFFSFPQPFFGFFFFLPSHLRYPIQLFLRPGLRTSLFFFYQRDLGIFSKRAIVIRNQNLRAKCAKCLAFAKSFYDQWADLGHVHGRLKSASQKPCSPTPQNVTLLEKNVFVDAITLNEVIMGQVAL